MAKNPDYKPTPGTNVIALIDGKEAGPFYLVQIDGQTATLQGIETHQVPVADIIRAAP
jgi:type II secretory pathway component HofQ